MEGVWEGFWEVLGGSGGGFYKGFRRFLEGLSRGLNLIFSYGEFPFVSAVKNKEGGVPRQLFNLFTKKSQTFLEWGLEPSV